MPTDLPLPPEVEQRIDQWENRRLYSPVETEKVEGNLRITKIRRTIPVTSHYYSNFNGREQPNR